MYPSCISPCSPDFCLAFCYDFHQPATTRELSARQASRPYYASTNLIASTPLLFTRRIRSPSAHILGGINRPAQAKRRRDRPTLLITENAWCCSLAAPLGVCGHFTTEDAETPNHDAIDPTALAARDHRTTRAGRSFERGRITRCRPRNTCLPSASAREIATFGIGQLQLLILGERANADNLVSAAYQWRCSILRRLIRLTASKPPRPPVYVVATFRQSLRQKNTVAHCCATVDLLL
ncbi:hypothetical protein DFP91_0858 [Pseudorhodoplanes sinuspersici]|nr:hypothetical protein DFP91_0858 [Pseudorhodoplanes sinuspersici]